MTRPPALYICLLAAALAWGCGGERKSNRDGSGHGKEADGGGDLGPAPDLAPADLGSADAQPGADAADDGGDPADDGLPAPICPPAVTPWAPGTPIFTEATADWRLDAVGAQGTRLAVLDYDGDGLPDLLVRKADGFEDFAEGGTRGKWLLRNTGSGFEDVTRSSGLLTLRFPGAADQGRPVSVSAAADVDNDGDLDVFLGKNVLPLVGDGDAETGEILLNRGDGTFELGKESNGLRRVGEVAVPASASFVDVDRDGNVDLWVPQNMPPSGDQPLQDRLLLGDGQGGFTDATFEFGLQTLDWSWVEDLNAGLAHSWAWSGTACDLNGDGTTELLAASYGRAPNLLFQGVRSPDGTVSFVNRSVASGYAYDERQDWSDNQSACCWCQLHRSDPGCAEVPAPTLIRCRSDADVFRWNHLYDREPWRLGGNSATTVCADVDNDGALDLLTTEIVHWDVGSSSDPSELLLNTGEPDVRFVRPGNEVTGLTRTRVLPDWNDGDMTAVVFDFDNDGWPDVYIGSSDYPGDRGLLWHQRAGEPGRFDEVAVADFFEHNRSHGVVAADFDRDGDLDLVVGHSSARCDASAPNNCYPTQQVRLFENIVGNRASWLQLRLEGAAGTNRSAIGARVVVEAGGIRQTQEVDGGHGHFNTQQDLTLHFGLGAACEATVTVRWPDAALTTETFRLPAGHRFHLKQGEAPRLVAEP